MGSRHHLIPPVGQHHTTHSPLQHQPPTPHHPFLWGGGRVEEVQGGTVSEDDTNVSTGVGHKTTKTWNMGCVELVGREGGGGGGLWRMRRTVKLQPSSFHVTLYLPTVPMLLLLVGSAVQQPVKK